MNTPQPELAGTLSVYDFPQDQVVITFEDGSQCKFEYAFFRKENGWYAVYTEHCGYYMFPAYAKIKGTERQ